MKQVKVKFTKAPCDGVVVDKIYDAVFVHKGGDIVAAFPALSDVYGAGPVETAEDCLCLVADDGHPCDLFTVWNEFEYVE